MTRQVRFQESFRAAMIVLSGQLWQRGPKGHVGGWRIPATRQRVRKLARMMARDREIHGTR